MMRSLHIPLLHKAISFRTIFLVTFIGVPAIVLLTFVGLFAVQAQDTFIRQAGGSVHDLALAKGQRLNGELTSNIYLLQTLSRDYSAYAPLINAQDNDIALLSKKEIQARAVELNKKWRLGDAELRRKVIRNTASGKLNTFAAKFPTFKRLMLIDPNGILLASGGENAPNYSQAEQQWWQHTVESSNEVQIEGPYVSDDGKQTLIDIVVPVVSPSVGIARGYLYASFDIRGMAFFSQDVTKENSLSLIDKSGRIYASSDKTTTGKLLPQEMLSTVNDGKVTWKTGVNLSSQSVIYSFVRMGKINNIRMNELGWTIVTQEQTTVALALLQHMLITMTFISASAIVLVIILGYLLTGLFRKPIANLTRIASGLLKGNLKLRAEHSSIRDFDILAATFNAMTEKLVRSRADLAASISDLSQGFVMADMNGNISMVNKAAIRLLNLTDMRQPKSISELFIAPVTIDVKHEFDKFIHNVRREQSYTIKELEFGPSIYTLMFSPIVIDKTTVGGVIQIIDITEQKVQQRSRDEFFSIASHELRTPLTIIRGNSSALLDGYGSGMKDHESKQMIESIHQSSAQLIDIVNDFLDVSHIEQHDIEYNIQVFELKPVVDGVVADMSTIASAKNIKLICDMNSFNDIPEISGDAGRVKQVIYNLISNAVRYTDTGNVRVGARTSGKYLELAVEDTGRGISLNSQKLLFHKFQQAGDSLFMRDSQRGTGLGLYISKLLCKGMGGTLRLDRSEIGKGSVFVACFVIADNEERRGVGAVHL